MKNLLMTKSRDCKSDLVRAQASTPYNNIGKHLLLINCGVTSSKATRPILAVRWLSQDWTNAMDSCLYYARDAAFVGDALLHNIVYVRNFAPSTCRKHK